MRMILATALALWANTATAQTICMDYGTMAANLMQSGIYKQSEGDTMSPQGQPARMELWLSESGSFAVIGVLNNGFACLILAGENYSEADSA